MLMPWSASPIAESSSVRYCLFSAIVAAKVFSHATTWSYDTATRTLTPSVSPCGVGGQTPHRSPAVFTGASHSVV